MNYNARTRLIVLVAVDHMRSAIIVHNSIKLLLIENKSERECFCDMPLNNYR